MAKSMKDLAEMLEHTCFRRRFLNGVDEDDVWRKLDRLQKEYIELVNAERERAQGVINEWRGYAAELEARLRKKEEMLK